ncbi:MAG: hypothetical protein AAGH15_28370 [Myxococcota bacterium]
MDWWRRVLGYLLPHRRLETLRATGRVRLRGEVLGPALERSPFTDRPAVAFRWVFAETMGAAERGDEVPVPVHRRCSTAALRLRVGEEQISVGDPGRLRWYAARDFVRLESVPPGDAELARLVGDRSRPLVLSETALLPGAPVELSGWVEPLSHGHGAYRAAATPGPRYRLRPDLGACALRVLAPGPPT